MSELSNTAPAQEQRRGLGTFAGVFTPSILTILGIILFLRMGFVVGEVGLGRALVIILLANGISVLTTFSLAAIATNFEVRGGGDYYLISRTLGPEYGGAIGIVLFLAQSVSVAFYAIGFAEGVSALVDISWLPPRVIAGVALGPLFVLSWLGSDWATRFQYVIMVVLTAALGAFLVGAIGAFDSANLKSNWEASGTLTFWTGFALFFPAVTGFTQGVSMSGELRDPAKSLPLGTFLAVFISLAIYFLAAVLFAGAMPGVDLIQGYDAMNRVAWLPWLISAGLFAATLSSSLASFLGAPRILQALATDRLFGFLNSFSKGSGPTDNPRRAVLLSAGIAIVTVIVGDLNLVAPIVSMFFLISYGLLNYATYFEARAASPSFRPRFRWYHRNISLLGFLACGATILAIDPISGAIALTILVLIHQYLARMGGPDRWADGSRSALFQSIRRGLHSMSDTVKHQRDWRPVSLVFSDDPARRERIVRFASWIEGGAGLTTAVRIVSGEGVLVRKRAREEEMEIAAGLRACNLEAFARVVTTMDIEAAFPVLLQSAGLGSIRPNLALFNWFDREETAEDAPALLQFGTYVRTALRHGCSTVVLASRSDMIEQLGQVSENSRRIDIWWRGDASSKLALLLAYLTLRHAAWSKAELRVMVVRLPDVTDEACLEALRAELDQVRINAEPVIVSDHSWDTLRRESADAALCFVNFRVRGGSLQDVEGEPLPTSLEGLPPLALVLAAQDIELAADPDEGVQAAAAQALDASAEVAQRAKQMRADVDALAATLAELATRRTNLQDSGGSAEELDALEREISATEAEMQATTRKALKLESKAQDLASEAEAVTPPILEPKPE